MADETKPGFWGWAQKHWILTFLLAGSAIALPVKLVAAAKTPAIPAAPAAGAAPPFKAGDVVLLDVSGLGQLQAIQPTGSVTVRIDSLTDVNGDPNKFMGSVTAPFQTASQSCLRAAVVGVVSRA